MKKKINRNLSGKNFEEKDLESVNPDTMGKKDEQNYHHHPSFDRYRCIFRTLFNMFKMDHCRKIEL